MLTSPKEDLEMQRRMTICTLNLFFSPPPHLLLLYILEIFTWRLIFVFTFLVIGPLPLNFKSVHRVLLPGLCSVRFTSLLSARTSQLQGSVEGSDSSQVGSCWLVAPPPPFAVTTRRKCIILRLRGTVTSFLHRNGRIIQVKC